MAGRNRGIEFDDSCGLGLQSASYCNCVELVPLLLDLFMIADTKIHHLNKAIIRVAGCVQGVMA
jgi:hypothetical protein